MCIVALDCGIAVVRRIRGHHGDHGHRLRWQQLGVKDDKQEERQVSLDYVFGLQLHHGAWLSAQRSMLDSGDPSTVGRAARLRLRLRLSLRLGLRRRSSEEALELTLG